MIQGNSYHEEFLQTPTMKKTKNQHFKKKQQNRNKAKSSNSLLGNQLLLHNHKIY